MKTKVTLLTTMCGPSGNAFPGWVVDVPRKEDAEYMFKNRFARPYDHERDAKARRGPQQAQTLQ